MDSTIEKLLKTEEDPVAVVTTIDFNGVLFARALQREEVPVIGVLKDTHTPFRYTRTCKKIFCEDIAGEGLLQVLLEIGSLARTKPVLIPIGDMQVLLYDKHRQALSDYFALNIPPREVIGILMDKTKFYAWGHEEFPFPRTITVACEDDIEAALCEIQYPVVFKPRFRDEAWTGARLPKASIFRDRNKLYEFYRVAKEIESVYILSEFIEGGDDHLVNTHFYYDDGQDLHMFVDHKIRQYPPLTGTGSLVVTANIPEIVDTSMAMLERLDYTGMGAIEFKRDDKAGTYKLIEACCGRPSSHFYIGLGEGINLPYLVYCHLVGMPLPHCRQPERRLVYIDERLDLQSAFHYISKGQLSLVGYLRSLLAVRVSVYFSLHDPLVGVVFVLSLFQESFHRCRNLFRRVFSFGEA